MQSIIDRLESTIATVSDPLFPYGISDGNLAPVFTAEKGTQTLSHTLSQANVRTVSHVVPIQTNPYVKTEVPSSDIESFDGVADLISNF
jgi:hypothetical protein